MADPEPLDDEHVQDSIWDNSGPLDFDDFELSYPEPLVNLENKFLQSLCTPNILADFEKRFKCEPKNQQIPAQELQTSQSHSFEIGIPMEIDTYESMWTKLRYVQVKNNILEYNGRGDEFKDNGFAQSSVPLTPMSHYFEVTITDPGASCYIAVGLCRRDYPEEKHPGWTKGSIAFHADDGKLFMGTGVGSPFGDCCNVNDVIGCGVIFPNIVTPSALEIGKMEHKWPWDASNKLNGPSARLPKYKVADGWTDDEDEDEEEPYWWTNRNLVCDMDCKVFFRRNSKLVGVKEVRIPVGGFYPCVGMMSANEKVKVDFQPLSG